MIVNGIGNPKVSAVDKSMFKAQGPLWHKKDRKKGIVPENRIFEPMIDYFHDNTKYIVADSGYDDGKLTDKCEFKKNDKYITRRLVVPMEKHKYTASKRLPYIRFFKSELGQHLFRLRKITVEPMFNILKTLFSLEPVWMKGKQNVQPLLLLGVFVYQLLLLFNFVNGRPVSHVKYILDGV
jgi:hypothetical protein